VTTDPGSTAFQQGKIDKMRKLKGFLLGMALLAPPAAAQPLRPDQQAFRALYAELVETDTTLSNGDCTLAASRMAQRLRAAGLPEENLVPFSVPEHPKEGGLVASLPGSAPGLKPILLLAHIDVVEAKREDWVRDPFKLVEEDGYFYARGAYDDKAQAAIWVDLMVRYLAEKHRPKRGIKIALTCGEETTWAFNGAEWLAKNRRDLIDAEFALNEGGGGRTDGKGIVDGGRLVAQTIQVGEKAVQNFRLEAISPGGHSMMPVSDNAAYRLAEAMLKLRDHDFPLELNPTTRTFFEKAGKARGGLVGEAMQAIAVDAGNVSARSVIDHEPMMRAMLRTTCVVTLVEAGHANNALPQRAAANVNCRILPGHNAEEVQTELAHVIADPMVNVSTVAPVWPAGKMPPLDTRIVDAAEEVGRKYFPGVPIIPAMTIGATDAIFLNAVDIPTYGAPGLWANPDGNGLHGLNERIEVKSLFIGRDYLQDFVRLLTSR
jgi:acetylornithine deacetylase/succinyl-diaminopimelate desuccinylase-like protein